MLREDEVVMLIMGILVFLFMMMNMDQFKKIKSWRNLVWGYCVFLSGWFCTILEGFFLENYLNLLEHVCYGIGSVFLAAWCWKIAHEAQEEKLQ